VLTGRLLLALLLVTSTVACHGKAQPTESAPKAESTPAAVAAPASVPAPAPAPARAAGAKLTDAECRRVVDHVLDVTAKEALEEEGTKLSAAEKKKHLAALRTELASDPELKKQAENCDEEYTRSEYTCMMSATTAEALDKCNESPN
jgi:hypothetical protein